MKTCVAPRRSALRSRNHVHLGVITGEQREVATEARNVDAAVACRIAEVGALSRSVISRLLHCGSTGHAEFAGHLARGVEFLG